MANKKKVIGGVIGVIVVLVGLFFGVNINPKDGSVNDQAKQFVDMQTGQPFTTNNLLGMVNAQNYTVYVTKSGKKYHTANCRYVLGKEISLTRQEAIEAGYTPCRRCKPDENIASLPQTPQPQTPQPQTDKTQDIKRDPANEDGIILE